MPATRYAANAVALGIDLAKRLESTSVAIYGNNAISQSAIYSLIGLGVGEIEHIAGDNNNDTSIGTFDFMGEGILRTLSSSMSFNADSFQESIAYISPHIKYSQAKRPKSSRIVLDTCGYFGSESFGVSNKGVDIGRDLHVIKCTPKSSADYDCINSLLTGALLADEVRKSVGFVSSYEQKLNSGDALNLELPSLLHRSALRLEPKKMSRVLVIGAGGLGTYCTYVLAKSGVKRGINEILLCEPDVVEETNLNRQLFYTGRVGELKANVLAERLSDKYLCNTTKIRITPRAEYFDEKFESNGSLDAIFCCTDTIESRISACKYAVSRGIPLVEGACTPTMGCITTFVPGATESVSKQRDLVDLLRIQTVENLRKSANGVVIQDNSCARVSNPSVITPNIVIGGLQAIALDSKYDASDVVIKKYPQVFLNSLQNSKFYNGELK